MSILPFLYQQLHDLLFCVTRQNHYLLSHLIAIIPAIFQLETRWPKAFSLAASVSRKDMGAKLEGRWQDLVAVAETGTHTLVA